MLRAIKSGGVAKEQSAEGHSQLGSQPHHLLMQAFYFFPSLLHHFILPPKLLVLIKYALLQHLFLAYAVDFHLYY